MEITKEDLKLMIKILCGLTIYSLVMTLIVLLLSIGTIVNSIHIKQQIQVKPKQTQTVVLPKNIELVPIEDLH